MREWRSNIVQVEYGITPSGRWVTAREAILGAIYKCPYCEQPIHRFNNKRTPCFKHIKKNDICNKNLFLKYNSGIEKT